MELTYDPMGIPAEFPALDQETFARVWSRVMPDESLSPIKPNVDQPAMPSPARSMTPTAPEASGRTTPIMDSENPPRPMGVMPPKAPPQPVTPALPAVPIPSNPPSVPDVCLGPQCIPWVPRLEELMDETLSAGQTYQSLARRASSRMNRSLSRCVIDCQRQLRRLSAAHFLITAARYQPRHSPLPAAAAMDMALRERFLAEQGHGAALRRAAAETNDPWLDKLYTELAGESNARCEILRGLLEQM